MDDVYASQTAAADGTFLTERIAPGKYLLVAEAYTPLTPEQRFRTAASVPRIEPRSTIEVPADGELKVDDLVLKPSRAVASCFGPDTLKQEIRAVDSSHPMNDEIRVRGWSSNPVTPTALRSLRLARGGELTQPAEILIPEMLTNALSAET